MIADQDVASPETELKFQVAAADLAALGRHPALAGAAKPVKVRSVYFDTADHALRKHGVSLRVRATARKYLQTVKGRPKGSAFTRDEWESALKDNAPDLEAAAATPAGDILARAKGTGELVAVVTTTVQRTVALYEDGASLIEVSLDKGDVSGGGRSEPVGEIELELKAGEPAALFDLARRLGEAAPLRLSFESKADRGYRLAGAGGAPKAQAVAVPPQATTAQAFRIVAHSCLLQISANAELVLGGRSAEAVHQTRIGVRRLRAAMSIFRDMLADAQFEALKTELKWLAGELGEARDLDVFLKDTLGGEDAAIATLRRRLEADRARAHEKAAAAVASPRYAALLLDLTAWVEAGPWLSAQARGDLRERPAPEFAAETLRALRKPVRKKGRALLDLDAGDRHRLRIQVKKLRYAAEFFAETFGPIAKRRRKFVQALKALQELLGELNDITVARERALRMVEGRGRSARAALAIGILVGRQEAREKGLLKETASAFAKFDKAKAFWTKVWAFPSAANGAAASDAEQPAHAPQ